MIGRPLRIEGPAQGAAAPSRRRSRCPRRTSARSRGSRRCRRAGRRPSAASAPRRRGPRRPRRATRAATRGAAGPAMPDRWLNISGSPMIGSTTRTPLRNCSPSCAVAAAHNATSSPNRPRCRHPAIRPSPHRAPPRAPPRAPRSPRRRRTPSAHAAVPRDRVRRELHRERPPRPGPAPAPSPPHRARSKRSGALG